MTATPRLQDPGPGPGARAASAPAGRPSIWQVAWFAAGTALSRGRASWLHLRGLFNGFGYRIANSREQPFVQENVQHVQLSPSEKIVLQHRVEAAFDRTEVRHLCFNERWGI